MRRVQLPLLLLLIAAYAQGQTTSCPGGLSQQFVWPPGQVREELARELRSFDGAIVPLTRDGVDLDPGPLSHGQSYTWACRRLHWGLKGNLSLKCDDGSLLADASKCRLVGCPWHRFAMRLPQDYEASAGANVDGLAGSAPVKQWQSMVLAGNGAFYALPSNAPTILRINASSGQPSGLSLSPPLAVNSMAYSAAVLGRDGNVYGVPYSATKVLRIDPEIDNVTTFGSLSSSGYKWSHGVLAADGRIYCIPAMASQVLQIDPKLSTAKLLSGSLESHVSSTRWSWGVVARSGQIYGIPDSSSKILRINPLTQTATTFGNVGGEARKWAHGVLADDGVIYGIPSSARNVLRIDPRTSTPTADASIVGLGGLPLGDYKWAQGVLGLDGNIYCIPSHYSMVLVIYPSLIRAAMLGYQPVPGDAAPFKFAGGLLAPDGRIHAFPSNEKRTLRINPVERTTESIGDALGGDHNKYSVAALAPNGDILAVPSAAKKLLRMSPVHDMCNGIPQATNLTCTLGLPCTVLLNQVAGRGSALDGSNAIWLTDFDSACRQKAYLPITGFTQPLEKSIRMDSAGIKRRGFTFGTGIVGSPTHNSRFCWASWLTNVDIVELGQFQLWGPVQGATRSCTLGVRCDLALGGLGFSAGTAVQIATKALSCGHANSSTFNFTGFANPHSLVSGDSDILSNHSLGITKIGIVGVYQLCWAQASREEAKPLTTTSFKVLLGEFRLVGPQLRESTGVFFRPLECWEGAQCIVEMNGTDLSSANRLSIRAAPDCETGYLAKIAGVTSVVAPSSSSGLSYLMGTPKEGGTYGNYSLCWHGARGGPGVFFRTLRVYGPINGGMALNCTLSYTCNLTLLSSAIVGVPDPWVDALGKTSELMLVPSNGTCPGSVATPWAGITNPLAPSGTSTFYDLATPLAPTYVASQGFVQTYALCWSRTGGSGTFHMRMGTLRVFDYPCDVPRATFGMSPAYSQNANLPACTSSMTGAQVDQLMHKETCAPNCATNYDSSEATLICNYGVLSPAAYECRKRCLFKPHVTNGQDMAKCVGLKHGEVCSITCASGRVKSGDLQCMYGRFEHRATMALDVLFDVPRCYYSCNAQKIGCAGSFGSGELVHGGTCNPACPAGATPSVDLLRCWDGSAQPASYDCKAACMQTPTVKNAKDLSFCKAASDGARCTLRCNNGYVKSGDLLCKNGAWTKETCLKPCAGPTVSKAASPPCEMGNVIPHGVRCVPQCQPGFSPDLEGSNTSLLCTDGQLAPATFVCKKSCMYKPLVEYADPDGLARCVGTGHGRTCNTPCLMGYKKTADLLCTNGDFSQPVCEKMCEEGPRVPNSLPNLCTWRAPKETCEVKCLGGYAATNVSVCSDGKWSSVKCLRTCRAPPNVRHSMQPSCKEGHFIKSGGTCSAHCAESFTATQPKLSCIDGTFTPEDFRCARACSAVGAIQNTADMSHCSGLQVGDTCQLKCAKGFRPTGHLKCKVDGWHQYKGGQFKDSKFLKRGQLVGEVDTAPNFQLSFKIILAQRAGRNYQGIIHITATGNNCCEDGDRVPIVLLQPSDGGSKAGDELQIFLDPGPGCALTVPLIPAVKTSVVVTFQDETLRVALDSRVVCTQSYVGLKAMSQSQDSKIFAGSPWYEPADAEISDLQYEQFGLDGTMPKCEAVFCRDPLPHVPGAVVGVPAGRRCVGKAYGFVCDDIRCPNGTTLTDKFVCGGFGTWRPQSTPQVRCEIVRCPARPPAVHGAAADMLCSELNYADICSVRCREGFISSAAFVCTAQGRWAALPGTTPSCDPKPCGKAPPVLRGNSVDMDRCNHLAPNASCFIGCATPWTALGKYQCQAQHWIEAPVCAKPEHTVGTASWVIKAGLAAEPSSEIHKKLASANDWAENVARAVSHALSEHFSDLSGKNVSVHILGYIGSAGDPQAARDQRRLQDSILRPATWRADVTFALVPNGTKQSEVSVLAAAFSSLQSSFLETLLLLALPTHATPVSALVTLSAPQVVQMPALVVKQLSTASPLTASNDEKTLRTTTSISTTTTTQLNVTTSGLGGGLSGPGDADGNYELPPEKEEEGTSWVQYLFMVCIPMALVMFCWSCYRFSKYNLRHSTDITASERKDWADCIEEFAHEDVMDGIDDKALSDFIAQQAAEKRRHTLKKGLAGHEDVDHTDHGHHKTVKDLQKDWKEQPRRQALTMDHLRDQARHRRCVRLSVFIAKKCCKRKKKKKKAKLHIDFVGRAAEEDEPEEELPADHDPYAAALKEAGEDGDDELQQEGEEEEEEDKEVDVIADGEEVAEGETIDEKTATIGSEIRPEDIEPKKSNLRRRCGRICAKICPCIARHQGCTSRLIYRLRNSNIQMIVAILDALNIHSKWEGQEKQEEHHELHIYHKPTLEDLIEAEDDNGPPAVPPSVAWECRHFGDKIVVHSHLFQDDDSLHFAANSSGKWVEEDIFICPLTYEVFTHLGHLVEEPTLGTFIAHFQSEFVKCYWIPGEGKTMDDVTQALGEGDERLVISEEAYNHIDFFDFAGCEKLAPEWAHAPAYFDHRQAAKLKAAKEQASVGSSDDPHGGNKVINKKRVKPDFVQLLSIETITTKFCTPNRRTVSKKVIHEKKVPEDEKYLGCSFSAMPPGPIFVQTVEKESWADHEDIKVGWELVAVDGEPVKDIKIELYAATMGRRPVKLKFNTQADDEEDELDEEEDFDNKDEGDVIDKTEEEQALEHQRKREEGDDDEKEKLGEENAESETAVSKSVMEEESDTSGSINTTEDEFGEPVDEKSERKKMTKSIGEAAKSAHQSELFTEMDEEKKQKLEEAIAKARETPLYQESTEKHRSQTAKEHMGIADGGLFDMLENAVEGEASSHHSPVVLGGSVWGWLAGEGDARGPCGK